MFDRAVCGMVRVDGTPASISARWLPRLGEAAAGSAAGFSFIDFRRSLNEYELDLLRQRSLSARYEKARRGELIVAAPVGFVKVGDRIEKDPDRRI